MNELWVNTFGLANLSLFVYSFHPLSKEIAHSTRNKLLLFFCFESVMFSNIWTITKYVLESE
jgi:hypothetical protein